MENLIKYFDRVKADEELKEKTKFFVKDKIAEDEKKLNHQKGSLYSDKERKFTLKKLSTAVALPIAACAVLVIGGYTFYTTPLNYVSYDINPSIEFGLNYFNKVVKAEGFNDDGKQLLSECEIMNLSAEKAIQKLTLEAKEEGYIKADGSTVVAVTTESKNEEHAEQLKNQMNKTLQTLLKEKNLRAVVYADTTDLQLRTEAKEYGLSPGKYKLILLLDSLDPNISIDRYRDARITDILMKADELLLQNQMNQSGKYVWNYDTIEDAAERVRETQEVMEQDTNQVQNQNTSPSATIEQEQERNGNQYQNSDSSGQIQNGYQDKNTSLSGIQQEQIINQNQNQGEGQSEVEQEQIQNQSQGTDTSDNGQQKQNQPQSDTESGNTPAQSKNPKQN